MARHVERAYDRSPPPPPYYDSSAVPSLVPSVVADLTDRDHHRRRRSRAVDDHLDFRDHDGDHNGDRDRRRRRGRSDASHDRRLRDYDRRLRDDVSRDRRLRDYDRRLRDKYREERDGNRRRRTPRRRDSPGGQRAERRDERRRRDDSHDRERDRSLSRKRRSKSRRHRQQYDSDDSERRGRRRSSYRRSSRDHSHSRDHFRPRRHRHAKRRHSISSLSDLSDSSAAAEGRRRRRRRDHERDRRDERDQRRHRRRRHSTSSMSSLDERERRLRSRDVRERERDRGRREDSYEEREQRRERKDRKRELRKYREQSKKDRRGSYSSVEGELESNRRGKVDRSRRRKGADRRRRFSTDMSSDGERDCNANTRDRKKSTKGRLPGRFSRSTSPVSNSGLKKWRPGDPSRRHNGWKSHTNTELSTVPAELVDALPEFHQRHMLVAHRPSGADAELSRRQPAADPDATPTPADRVRRHYDDVAELSREAARIESDLLMGRRPLPRVDAELFVAEVGRTARGVAETSAIVERDLRDLAREHGVSLREHAVALPVTGAAPERHDREEEAEEESSDDDGFRVVKPKKPRNKPNGSSGSVAGSSWACNFCTFLNKPLYLQCEMCQRRRDDDPAASGSGDPAKASLENEKNDPTPERPLLHELRRRPSPPPERRQPPPDRSPSYLERRRHPDYPDRRGRPSSPPRRRERERSSPPERRQPPPDRIPSYLERRQPPLDDRRERRHSPPRRRERPSPPPERHRSPPPERRQPRPDDERRRRPSSPPMRRREVEVPAGAESDIYSSDDGNADAYGAAATAGGAGTALTHTSIAYSFGSSADLSVHHHSHSVDETIKRLHDDKIVITTTVSNNGGPSIDLSYTRERSSPKDAVAAADTAAAADPTPKPTRAADAKANASDERVVRVRALDTARVPSFELPPSPYDVHLATRVAHPARAQPSAEQSKGDRSRERGSRARERDTDASKRYEQYEASARRDRMNYSREVRDRLARRPRDLRDEPFTSRDLVGPHRYRDHWHVPRTSRDHMYSYELWDSSREPRNRFESGDFFQTLSDDFFKRERQRQLRGEERSVSYRDDGLRFRSAVEDSAWNNAGRYDRSYAERRPNFDSNMRRDKRRDSEVRVTRDGKQLSPFPPLPPTEEQLRSHEEAASAHRRRPRRKVPLASSLEASPREHPQTVLSTMYQWRDELDRDREEAAAAAVAPRDPPRRTRPRTFFDCINDTDDDVRDRDHQPPPEASKAKARSNERERHRQSNINTNAGDAGTRVVATGAGGGGPPNVSRGPPPPPPVSVSKRTYTAEVQRPRRWIKYTPENPRVCPLRQKFLSLIKKRPRNARFRAPSSHERSDTTSMCFEENQPDKEEVRGLFNICAAQFTELETTRIAIMLEQMEDGKLRSNHVRKHIDYLLDHPFRNKGLPSHQAVAKSTDPAHGSGPGSGPTPTPTSDPNPSATQESAELSPKNETAAAEPNLPVFRKRRRRGGGKSSGVGAVAEMPADPPEYAVRIGLKKKEKPPRGRRRKKNGRFSTDGEDSQGDEDDPPVPRLVDPSDGDSSSSEESSTPRRKRKRGGKKGKARRKASGESSEDDSSDAANRRRKAKRGRKHAAKAKKKPSRFDSSSDESDSDSDNSDAEADSSSDSSSSSPGHSESDSEARVRQPKANSRRRRPRRRDRGSYANCSSMDLGSIYSNFSDYTMVGDIQLDSETKPIGPPINASKDIAKAFEEADRAVFKCGECAHQNSTCRNCAKCGHELPIERLDWVCYCGGVNSVFEETCTTCKGSRRDI